MKHYWESLPDHDLEEVSTDMMKSLALMQHNGEEYFMVGGRFFEGELEEEHEGMSADQISELYSEVQEWVDDGIYMVLTDDEADEKAEEYILDSAWAFNADFICRHAGLPYEASEMISSYTKEKCEDANDVVLAMIDIDHFVQDTIRSDGRGHFISYYDGEEHEENVFDEWFYIYRI